MNILLCTDNIYAMPTGVLMHSISDHDKDVKYYVFVDDAFSELNRQRFTDIANYYGSEITFYTISKEQTENMPVKREDQPGYITKSAYNRLFAASMLPKDMEKIIYLDGDIVVRKSLRPLWDTDIEGYAVGVVNDMHELKHIQSMRLPYDMKDGYFNSGVLLINVKYWREHNCMALFDEITEKHQDVLTLHDQDVLNIAFHDKKKWLPVTYNMQNGFLYKNQKLWIVPEIEEDLNVMKHDPAVVHFSTWDKPWKLECFHPYCKDWRKYFFRSAWRNDRLTDEEENPTLIRKFRNWLVRHCLYVPANLYQKV